MAQLGARFIERTRGEVIQVRELIGRVASGDTAAFEQLNYLVHRINGGGATFGFNAISDHAGEIERLIEPAVRQGVGLEPSVLDRLAACGRKLEQELRNS